MATPRQQALVGIFLSICGVILVGILVVLSGLRREETVPYVIEFNENVSGLFPGSDVRYRGVPVGRVTNITVAPNNLVRARVEIRPSIVRLHQGTIAQLNPAGITGQLYINLDGGNPEGEQLPAGAAIPSTTSLITNLSAELPTILASINSVLLRLDRAMGEGGQIASIMRDVGNLMTVLNTTTTQIGAQTGALLERTNTVLESEVRPLIAAADTSLKITREALENTAPALQAALVSATQTLQQLDKQLAGLDLQKTNTRAQVALQRFTQLAERLGHTSAELDLTLQQVRGTTSNLDFNVRQALRNLRETLVSVKQLFDYLEQDPSALLTGKRMPVQREDGQRRR
jgi:phospholipid/cholesterol/gamma-HCH transport system substrate-binding protein